MANPEAGSQTPQSSEGNAMTSFSAAFADKDVRMKFIRKVYSIVCVQLLFTFGCIFVGFLYKDALKDWLRANWWVLILLLIANICVLLALICVESLRRNYPTNMILLGIFTLLDAALVTFMTIYYKTDTVLIAMGVTFFVVMALTAFALQTKIDFTVYRQLAFILVLVLIGMGIVMIFWRPFWLHLIYAVLGTLIFSFLLVIDTQLIVGGRRDELSPEEYVLGALIIYIDIIRLFSFILQLTGMAR